MRPSRRLQEAADRAMGDCSHSQVIGSEWEEDDVARYRLLDMSDDDDERELEVAEMARRAAMAASERRKQIKSAGGELTLDDIDPEALQDLSTLLEEIEAWTPGFSGAMIFHGEGALPVVSLIRAGNREAMRRSLTHVGSSVRQEIELLERDAFGGFVNSITSTTRGAVLVFRLNEDLLVVAIEGEPANLADAWKAVGSRKSRLLEASANLVPA